MQGRNRSRRILGVLLLALAMPASAQIVGAGAGGYINFKSGFPPFNAPFGFQTTGIRPIALGPGGGLFLQRWHLSPDGYAEGGTGLRIFNTASSYLFQVPVNTYLFQRRNACFVGARPAELFIHWDAVFQIGGLGFPPIGPHIGVLSYPVVGQNAPGPGSASLFFARLTYGVRNVGAPAFTPLGSAWIGYFDFRPGAAFAVQPTVAFLLPRIGPGQEFLVWGDVWFQTRGCPPFFAPSSLNLQLGKAEGGEGSIGVQEIPPEPPHDPSIPDIGIDPALIMDMPLPELPIDGTGTMLMEVTEDYDGNMNHRPQIDPLGEQLGMEGVPLSFTASATDLDGDLLTWSLEDAPDGMSIDSFGNVSWTPAAGQSGVYQVKVKADDNHGALAQTDEQVVTVIVEGSNHAPSLYAPDAFVGEGDTLTYSLYAYDPDPGDSLTFTLASPAPAGASLSPDGLLTWTPTEEQGPRDYTFRVRVTDDGSPNLWRESSFTVQVGEANQPPVVEPIPPLNAEVGVQLSYQVVASDPDTRPGPEDGAAGPLSYQLQGEPAGAAIDEDGLLTWTPGPDQLGTFSFGVMVTDSQGGIGGQPVTVTVGAKPVENKPGVNGLAVGNAGRGRRVPRVRP